MYWQRTHFLSKHLWLNCSHSSTHFCAKRSLLNVVSFLFFFLNREGNDAAVLPSSICLMTQRNVMVIFGVTSIASQNILTSIFCPPPPSSPHAIYFPRLQFPSKAEIDQGVFLRVAWPSAFRNRDYPIRSRTSPGNRNGEWEERRLWSIEFPQLFLTAELNNILLFPWGGP